MAELLIVAAAVFAGGVVQGCTGFGLGLVAAPCLMLILSQKVVVPMLVIISGLNSLIIAVEARRHVRAGIFLPLAVGGALGLPGGIYILNNLNTTLFKILAGILVAVFAVVLLTGWRRPARNHRFVLFPVGLVSGVIGGSTAMGGPPAILFLANQNTPKEVFRANLVAYFFLLNCASASMLTFIGLMNARVVGHAALTLPALLLGTYIGVKASRRIPQRVFMKVAMTLVAVMGLVLAASNLRGL